MPFYSLFLQSKTSDIKKSRWASLEVAVKTSHKTVFAALSVDINLNRRFQFDLLTLGWSIRSNKP